jgi:hypothetical protein
MTGEHLWSDWLPQFLPSTDLKTHTIVFNTHDAQLRSAPESRVKASGPPRDRRQFIVCQRCNNGWMSELEKSIKPILGPMLRGWPTRITTDSQRLLSRWIEKTVLVYEFETPANMVATDDYRRTFMSRDDAGELTKIWIGEYSGPTHEPRPRSHTFAHTPYDGTLERLHRVTTITVGHVIIYAIISVSTCCADIGAIPILNDTDYLLSIWPGVQTAIEWPPSRKINSQQHLWLSDWYKVDTLASSPGWPSELPVPKIDVELWKELPDIDAEPTMKNGPNTDAWKSGVRAAFEARHGSAPDRPGPVATGMK